MLEIKNIKIPLKAKCLNELQLNLTCAVLIDDHKIIIFWIIANRFSHKIESAYKATFGRRRHIRNT